MQLLTRKLLLICLMLWLPLQGYAAVTMPFCKHNADNSHAQHQMSQHQMSETTPDGQGGQDKHAGHAQHQGKASSACENCSLCHMCSSMALPSFAHQTPIKTSPLFNFPSQASFSPIFPEQPQRPPLALSV